MGLLVGALAAAGIAPYAGMSGFSESGCAMALGYVCSMCVGAVVGIAAGRRSRFRSVSASVVTGAMMGLLTSYVLRSVPLPWLNLVWLDGTAGPAGELPMVVLPLVGMLCGCLWGKASVEGRSRT